MLFPETPVRDARTIILLHGGGLSDWSLQPVAAALAPDLQVIAPIIDGHGAHADVEFESIEACAEKLIAHIDAHHGGKVFALGGLSLGAQIAAEVLARRPQVAQYTILESALAQPIPGMAQMAPPLYTLLYPLIRQRWFANMQAKALLVPEEMRESYYRDSVRMTRRSLINITVSNSTWRVPDAIAATTAHTLVLVGEKEMRAMRDSARLLHEKIAQSELYIAPAMKHGEFSLAHPQAYAALLRSFFARRASFQ